MKFEESPLAHKLLDGLKGIEIGASAHNPFGLDTINVDLYPTNSMFKEKEMETCGEVAQVDVVAPGDCLPFADKSYDYIINSHVLEHFYDPIAALEEWARVARRFIYLIIPHKQRTFDKEKPITTIEELEKRHACPNAELKKQSKHWNIWTTEDFTKLVKQLGYKIHTVQDKDDKVGNGFTVVIELPPPPESSFLQRLIVRLIQNLRPGDKLNESRAEFFALIPENLENICSAFSLRWLISIVDTYADHGSRTEQSNATIISTYANVLKMADTAQLLTTPENSKLPQLLNGVVLMYDEVNSLLLSSGDMPGNLFYRIDEKLKQTPVLRKLFEEIKKRLARHSQTMQIANYNPNFYKKQYFPNRKNWIGNK